MAVVIALYIVELFLFLIVDFPSRIISCDGMLMLVKETMLLCFNVTMMTILNIILRWYDYIRLFMGKTDRHAFSRDADDFCWKSAMYVLTVIWE